MRSNRGGCTLSHCASQARDEIIRFKPVSHRTRSDNNKVDRNRRKSHALVDGSGGAVFINNLEENFHSPWSVERSGSFWVKERQAQPYPQNWVGWCPGSSRTKLACFHPRAKLAFPTSATRVVLSIEHQLDQLWFYRVCGATVQQTGPGSRRNLEAADRIAMQNFENDYITPGSILAQE